MVLNTSLSLEQLTALKAQIDAQFSALTADQILEQINLQRLGDLTDTPRQVVNNWILNNRINLKLRAIAAQPTGPDYDTEIPNTGGMTVRLAALAGIDFFTVDTGDTFNPNNAQTNAMVALLRAVNVFTDDQVTAFWNVFRVPYTIIGNIVYAGYVGQIGDINAALNIDRVTGWREFYARLARAYNAVAEGQYNIDLDADVPGWDATIEQMRSVE